MKTLIKIARAFVAGLRDAFSETKQHLTVEILEEVRFHSASVTAVFQNGLWLPAR